MIVMTVLRVIILILASIGFMAVLGSIERKFGKKVSLCLAVLVLGLAIIGLFYHPFV
jgi:hypothetical protein